MKPELTILTADDRLATWEEVRRATSDTPDRVLELCYTQGTHCEIDSELGASSATLSRNLSSSRTLARCKGRL